MGPMNIEIPNTTNQESHYQMQFIIISNFLPGRVFLPHRQLLIPVKLTSTQILEKTFILKFNITVIFLPLLC